MTMYVHEDSDLDDDLRVDALTLALDSPKYDFCGTYFGLKIAAGYLHHRYGLAPERFCEVIPTTHDVVPEEYHRSINAVYVEDSTKTVHVVINYYRDELSKLEPYVRRITEDLLGTMEKDEYYNYSVQIGRTKDALDKGYKLSFEMLCFDAQDVPSFEDSVNASIYRKGWVFELVSVGDLEKIMRIDICRTSDSCTITWSE